MKKKTSPTVPLDSLRAIALRLIAFALMVWLVAAGLITHSLAAELDSQMRYHAWTFVSLYAEASINHTPEKAQLPGYAEYCRVHMAHYDLPFTEMYSASPLFPNLNDTNSIVDFAYTMPFQAAISYRDSQGRVISTAESHLAFSYMTAELWQSAKDLTPVSGYAYINLSNLDPACYTQEDADLGHFIRPAFLGYNTGRFTGYFEKNEFHPVTVAYSSQENDPLPAQDRDGHVEWNTVYQATAPADMELVTVYATGDFGPWPFQSYSVDMGPVTIDGTQYPRLEDTLPKQVQKESLWDAVVTASDSYTDTAGEEIIVQVALRTKPLPFAMRRLIGFYIISFLVMAVVIHLILRAIRKNLVEPVARVVWCTKGKPLPLPEHSQSPWAEPQALEGQYAAMAEAFHEADTEATRLQTALEYAQNAEQKRRQMISNITHELKTPLSIIHSYAEGLRDGIAADKQEQYLTVILEEAERMDAMVLEMLDLSRLEAGKVRLSADRFSLLGLTHSICRRLAPLAEEKALQLHFYIAEEFDITADESRVSQVITNFVTNAIKYTPPGGNIWVKVYRYKGQTHFVIENECSPLPPEALAQIWDSFYRAEASRTTKGTGLGLSIAKAIIDLHGGTVGAQNTRTGVEFQFTLP